MNRALALDRLADPSEPWDLLVVGGGATGLGIAVDAATRGYRTALLEQGDFAESTSSKSTKLIHGGVRYLRGGEVGLVRESLRERRRLLRNAPGLVRPQAFLVPAYRWHERILYGVGLTLYDLLGGASDPGMGRTGHLSASAAWERIPNLARPGLRGGTLYWDGQFDDARLAVALAKTASAHGAAAANHVRVEGLVKEGGRVRGVRAVDRIGGTEFEVRARVVVCAAGVFTDEIRRFDAPEADPLIVPSQGIHLVLDRDFLGGETAIMIPGTDDGRVLFAIPWKGRLLLGTTDTGGVPVALNPRPLAEEVDYLLEHAGRFLARAPKHCDILSCFAGLRPLVRPRAAAAGETSKISRSHYLATSPSGLVLIAGGKWTTYRQMAEDAVDLAAATGGLEARACATRDLLLVPEGSEEDPSSTEDRYDPALPLTPAMLRRALEEEQAMSVDDVLSRRSRCTSLDALASERIAPRVAAEMAALMGRDSDWIAGQVAAFARELASYRPPTSQSPSVGEPEGS